MAGLWDRVKNLWTDSLVDVKELWAPEEIQEATVLVNRLDQLHREDLARHVEPLEAKIKQLEYELTETEEIAADHHRYLSGEVNRLEAEVERLTPKLAVGEQAQKLAADIDQAIAHEQKGLSETDEDSYVTRAEHRDAIGMLSRLKVAVLTGRIDVDLTTEICYEQDQTGIAQEKDIYESSVASADEFIERAKGLGHKVAVSEFHDGERRWAFLETWEAQQLAECESQQDGKVDFDKAEALFDAHLAEQESETEEYSEAFGCGL